MILVTGGTGLVGAHLLLHLLENKEEVTAIYRTKNKIEATQSLFNHHNKMELFSKINWIKADILDIPSLEIAFQNIEYVYHCAAAISFNPDDENLLRKVNIEGTANIVNFCIEKKVKKLCYVSSIAALGSLSQNETMITEESIWNPEILHSDYAISKYGGEIEVWRAQQEGIPVVIVNPGVIFGNGIWKDGSGAFIKTIKKGIPFYTHGFSGYVAVSDVVTIMHELMKSKINNERFIVIAENKSYKDIIYTIAEKSKATQPKVEALPWMLAIAWRMDWVFSMLFRTKRKISKNGANSLLNTDLISNEKVKTTLNYTFQDIDSYLDSILPSFK